LGCSNKHYNDQAWVWNSGNAMPTLA